MIKSQEEIDMRIHNFLTRKAEEFPEVFEDRPRRHLTFADVTSLFSPPKLKY